MSKISRAKFFLDKALHTNGAESLNAYYALNSLVSSHSVDLQTLQLTPSDLQQLGSAAALEAAADFIKHGVWAISHASSDYITEALENAERLVCVFNLTLPETYQTMVEVGKRFARIDVAFDEAERAVESGYPWIRSDYERELQSQKNARMDAVKRPLQEVGICDVYLWGERQGDLGALRSRRHSLMKNPPTFKPEEIQTDRATLVDRLGHISSSYRDVCALADAVVENTGHARGLALEELQEKAEAIGIRLGTRSSGDDDFRVPVNSLEDVERLAVLEALGQEVARQVDDPYSHYLHLKEVALALLKPSKSQCCNPFQKTAAEATSILRHNVRASFALAAAAALKAGESSVFGSLMRGFGYDGWAIDHVQRDAGAKERFLDQLASFGPIRSWNSVSKKLRHLKPHILKV